VCGPGAESDSTGLTRSAITSGPRFPDLQVLLFFETYSKLSQNLSKPFKTPVLSNYQEGQNHVAKNFIDDRGSKNPVARSGPVGRGYISLALVKTLVDLAAVSAQAALPSPGSVGNNGTGHSEKGFADSNLKQLQKWLSFRAGFDLKHLQRPDVAILSLPATETVTVFCALR
jgi:hypothetical protein